MKLRGDGSILPLALCCPPMVTPARTSLSSFLFMSWPNLCGVYSCIAPCARLQAIPRNPEHSLRKRPRAQLRKANVTPILHKGKTEAPGNQRPDSLSSDPGKVMEQLILKNISKHMGDNKVIRSGRPGFIKYLLRLNYWITFSNEKTALLNDGRGGDAVCLVFRKAFHMFPIIS